VSSWVTPPIALTLDTYSHIIPSLQQEAASVIATAILGSGSTPPNGALWQNNGGTWSRAQREKPSQ
jgi:hypothetical protein